MMGEEYKEIERCIRRFIKKKYSDKLNIEKNKETVIQIKAMDLLEVCPDLFKDDHPLVREIRKKMVYNCIIKDNDGFYKTMYIYPSLGSK